MRGNTPLTPVVFAKIGKSQPLTPQKVVDATAAMTPEQAAQTRQNIGADTPATVTAWLDEHVDPDTGYVIDNSLTVEGAAADAKAVGDKISAVTVAPENTTFFKKSVNLVNPATITADKYVDQTNGKIKNGVGHKCTDYISVKPNTAYCFNTSNDQTNIYCRFAFYNESKTYISGDAGNINSKFGNTVTSPANAAYMVYSDETSTIPMIAEGNNKPAFEEYGVYYIDSQYVLNGNGDLVVNLPKDLYALVGFELNIYFENITEDWVKYKWNVDCPVGKQMERGYSITPAAADAGDHYLIITVYQSPEIAIRYRATLHVIVTSANDGVTKDIIVLGDSTTYDGTAIAKIHENLTGDGMQVNTLGTMGTAPNNHEGRSGWSFATYFTKASVTYPSPDPRGTIYNPFYNPNTQTFDASYYFANSGVSIPDWFFINMGINDTFDFKNDVQIRSGIDTVIDYYDAAIASLKEAAPNMNIGVCLTIPPNHSQDAFGKAYDCNQNRDQYKRNNTLFVQRLIAEYGGREDEGIYLVPIHTNLDTIYNMGMESLPVNGRNTSVTYQSPIGNGGVHPASSGYWQIADVYTAFLKGTS